MFIVREKITGEKFWLIVVFDSASLPRLVIGQSLNISVKAYVIGHSTASENWRKIQSLQRKKRNTKNSVSISPKMDGSIDPH